MASEIWNILIDCENQLGWLPDTTDIIKSRAVMHRIMTRAIIQHGYTERDLWLAVNWAKRKRLPIDSPLQLLGFVEQARKFAADAPALRPLDVQHQAAIDWEYRTHDARSSGWITRLTRSFGPARADVLDEWREAGRGWD